MRKRAGEGAPDITKMATMVSHLMLFSVVTSSMVMGVSAFSTTTRMERFDVEEQYRRNLLANDLGRTPPMG